MRAPQSAQKFGLYMVRISVRTKDALHALCEEQLISPSCAAQRLREAAGRAREGMQSLWPIIIKGRGWRIAPLPRVARTAHVAQVKQACYSLSTPEQLRASVPACARESRAARAL